MASILPDDIKEIENVPENKQIAIIYGYIKYLKEQLEFWTDKQEKQNTSLQGRIEILEEIIINGGQ